MICLVYDLINILFTIGDMMPHVGSDWLVGGWSKRNGWLWKGKNTNVNTFAGLNSLSMRYFWPLTLKFIQFKK